jgi:hypothetical protein
MDAYRAIQSLAQPCHGQSCSGRQDCPKDDSRSGHRKVRPLARRRSRICSGMEWKSGTGAPCRLFRCEQMPAHTAWKGWTNPRCEELSQNDELRSIEQQKRADEITPGACQRAGGTVINPNENTISEGACTEGRGYVDQVIKEKGWCPHTRGCRIADKWLKLPNGEPGNRCKMPAGSHETDCRSVRE